MRERTGAGKSGCGRQHILHGFVIRREISFGTWSARGLAHVGRIITVAGSCKLHDRNILNFLTQAIQTHWRHGTSLIPALVTGINKAAITTGCLDSVSRP